MKVKDLIKKLQILNPDEEIYIYEGQHVANECIALQNAFVKIREDSGRVILHYSDSESSEERINILI